eukprot:8427592-Alexandrium_andersonii.AAC.1
MCGHQGGRRGQANCLRSSRASALLPVLGGPRTPRADARRPFLLRSVARETFAFEDNSSEGTF